jgi:hypothetical protein
MRYEKASPHRLAFYFATVTVFVTVVKNRVPKPLMGRRGNLGQPTTCEAPFRSVTKREIWFARRVFLPDGLRRKRLAGKLGSVETLAKSSFPLVLFLRLDKGDVPSGIMLIGQQDGFPALGDSKAGIYGRQLLERCVQGCHLCIGTEEANCVG